MTRPKRKSLGIALVTALEIFLTSQLAIAGSYDELIQASKMGDIPTMHALLKRGLDPNSTDKAGNSLLTIAATEGNEALLKVLLAYKPKLNGRNQHGETALQLAAYKGYEGIVWELLAAGAPMDTPGWPALIYATFAGHEKIVEMLLNAGADKNIQAENGMTALMFATQNGMTNTVRLLIAAGANPDISTLQGVTAYGLSLKAKDPEITRMLDEALGKYQTRARLEAEERAVKDTQEDTQERQGPSPQSAK
ncbi:MAG: hypothetical protein RIR18_916 [Pseudomonadota bacterium]|jgi:ankyrin repeat protein